MGKKKHLQQNTAFTLKTSSGGVRGIVMLQVLREIEQVLGGRIPIQDFFDLIVGTRLVASRSNQIEFF